MQCFNHPDQPAIGTCKACSKGLCPDCAADLDHGIACKGKHEPRVHDLEFIISKNAKALNSSRGVTWAGPLFYLFLGLLFSASGVFWVRETNWFMVLFGAGCLAFSAVLLAHRRAVWGAEKNDS